MKPADCPDRMRLPVRMGRVELSLGRVAQLGVAAGWMEVWVTDRDDRPVESGLRSGVEGHRRYTTLASLVGLYPERRDELVEQHRLVLARAEANFELARKRIESMRAHLTEVNP